MGLQLSPVISGGSGGGGGGGFVNPMPNGTYLQTITDTAVTFNLAGYSNDLGAAVFGDLVTGVNTSIGTTDDFTTFFSGVAMAGTKTEFFSSDITSGRETVVSWDSNAFEFEIKTEDSVANALGFNYAYRYLNDLPANDDILATIIYGGNEYDGVNPSSEVDYAKDIFSIKQVDPTVGTGSTGQLNKYIRAEGADSLYQTIDNRGILNRMMSNYDAQSVTGGVAYISLETSPGSETYAYGLGGGTTVPGAVANWSTGAIFSDQDATTFNRVWMNTGDSTTANFQRVATLNSNTQLAFGDGTASLPAFSFASDPDTGMYNGGSNTLVFSTGGTARLQINSATSIQTNLQFSWGASTAPSPTARSIGRGTNTLQYNVPTGDTHVFTVNGSTNVTMGATTLGLYGVGAVSRATTAIAEAAFVENAGGTAVNVDSTFGGYTLQQVVQALQSIGLLT